MNYKREGIKEFVQNKIPEIIEKAFEKHREKLLENVDEKLSKVKEKIEQNLGKDAISPTGELKKAYKDTPLGKE